MTPVQAEAARIAANLAKNCNYAVFPCREDKAPAWPKRSGGRGFLDATVDPGGIKWVWEQHPGELIGVATGAVSGIDLLDIDIKHDAALAWWQEHHHRLPATRTHRTRGGGLHLLMIHASGVRCSTGKPTGPLPPGVDVRGDGGYLIHWFAAGLACLDHSPPAPWPGWLLELVIPKPPSISVPIPSTRPSSPRAADAAIEGVLRHVEHAREGNRNAALHWGACRLGERIRAGEIAVHEAEAWLLAAARQAGLQDFEARATIHSGFAA